MVFHVENYATMKFHRVLATSMVFYIENILSREFYEITTKYYMGNYSTSKFYGVLTFTTKIIAFHKIFWCSM